MKVTLPTELITPTMIAPLAETTNPDMVNQNTVNQNTVNQSPFPKYSISSSTTQVFHESLSNFLSDLQTLTEQSIAPCNHMSTRVIKYAVSGGDLTQQLQASLDEKIPFKPATHSLFESLMTRLHSILTSVVSPLQSSMNEKLKNLVQSSSAQTLEKTHQFSSILTTLRLAGQISVEDHAHMLKLYTSESSDELKEGLKEELKEQLTVLRNKFTALTSSDCSITILNNLLLQNNPMQFLQELAAHLLLLQLPYAIKALSLTQEEYGALTALQIAYSSGQSIQPHTDILESISNRYSALQWLDSIGNLFSHATTPQNIIKEQLKNAIIDNDLQKFKTLFLQYYPSDGSCTTSEAILRREVVTKVDTAHPKNVYSLFSNQLSYQKQLSLLLNKLQQFSKIVKETTSPLTLSQFQHQLQLLQKKLTAMVSSEVIAAIAPSVIGTLQARCNQEIEGVVSRISANALEQQQQTKQIALHQIQFSNVHLPQTTYTPHRVSVWYHTAGYGHLTCARNIQNALEQEALCKVSITDAGREVVKTADIVYKVLGKLITDDKGQAFSFDSLFNYLCKKDLIIALKLLQTLFGSRSPAGSAPESHEPKRSLIRQRLLAENPELLILAYAHDLDDITAVADELGIPVIYVATDFDYGRGDVKGYQHFVEAVPTLNNIRARNTLGIGSTIHQEQVVEIGLPVHLDYEKTYSSEELAPLRKELGIQPDEKVIVISSGGAGVANPLPEYLATHYTNSEQPWRLIVITGNNHEYKEHLETHVLPKLKESNALQITVLGFRTDKAKISQLADLTCGKGGGLDTFENRKLQLPKVFDEIKPSIITGHRFAWEQLNGEVVEDDATLGKQFGKRLHTLHAAIPTFALMLDQPRALIHDELSEKRASDLLQRLVVKRLTAATSDQNFQAKKQFWKELQASLQS